MAEENSVIEKPRRPKWWYIAMWVPMAFIMSVFVLFVTFDLFRQLSRWRSFENVAIDLACLFYCIGFFLVFGYRSRNRLIISLLMGFIIALLSLPIIYKGTYGHRSKQSEAKTNLSAIHTAQNAYHGEFGTYGTTFTSINWEPEGQNRYWYCLDGWLCVMGAHIEGLPKYPGDLHKEGVEGINRYKVAIDPKMIPGLEKYHPVAFHEGFTIVAFANIDGDDDIDIWTLDQEKNLVNVFNDIDIRIYEEVKKFVLVFSLPIILFVYMGILGIIYRVWKTRRKKLTGKSARPTGI